MQTHPMRRKDRALSPDDAKLLLEKCEYGTLATVSGEGWPYATPVSYVYRNGKIYIHCADSGHKLENIANSSKVCFCVVGKTQPIYDKDFTTYFESAIAFGHIVAVTDEQEKYDSLYALAKKYLPDHMDKADGDIRHSFKRTVVLAIIIEQLTGKAKKAKPQH